MVAVRVDCVQQQSGYIEMALLRHGFDCCDTSSRDLQRPRAGLSSSKAANFYEPIRILALHRSKASSLGGQGRLGGKR